MSPQPTDLGAAALAALAGVLGVAAGSGPLLPGLAAAVVLAGSTRARIACAVVLAAVAPLLVAIGLPDRRMVLAGLFLGLSALVFYVRAGQRRGGGSVLVIAARAVLAAGLVMVAVLLAGFAVLFL